MRLQPDVRWLMYDMHASASVRLSACLPACVLCLSPRTLWPMFNCQGGMGCHDVYFLLVCGFSGQVHALVVWHVLLLTLVAGYGM